MCGVFCHTKEGLQPAGVWEHGAEENVWTEEEADDKIGETVTYL